MRQIQQLIYCKNVEFLPNYAACFSHYGHHRNMGRMLMTVMAETIR